jgi:hypothetical protein
MAYVIAEPCMDIKHKTCADVCPVQCIYPESDDADRMLYINPDSPNCTGRFDLPRGVHQRCLDSRSSRSRDECGLDPER